MIGTELVVTFLDGTEHTAVLSARAIVDTERRFNMGALKVFTVEARMEAMWFVAWAQLYRDGKVTGWFDEFVDRLAAVRVVDELPPPPAPDPTVSTRP